REGNIWVTTANGVDRFRALAVPTIAAKQGLSVATVWSVLSAKDGAVWLGTSDGLKRWKNGQVTTYRRFGDRRLTDPAELSVARKATENELVDDVGSLFEDDRGRIWVFAFRGVAYF